MNTNFITTKHGGRCLLSVIIALSALLAMPAHSQTLSQNPAAQSQANAPQALAPCALGAESLTCCGHENHAIETLRQHVVRC